MTATSIGTVTHQVTYAVSLVLNSTTKLRTQFTAIVGVSDNRAMQELALTSTIKATLAGKACAVGTPKSLLTTSGAFDALLAQFVNAPYASVEVRTGNAPQIIVRYTDVEPNAVMTAKARNSWWQYQEAQVKQLFALDDTDAHAVACKARDLAVKAQQARALADLDKSIAAIASARGITPDAVRALLAGTPTTSDAPTKRTRKSATSATA